MDFVSVIEEESAALARAMRAPGALSATVPACPGWTGADLVWHIGAVQTFWTAVVEHADTSQPAHPQPRRPDDYGLLDWYDRQRAALVAAFRRTPADARRWTWWGSGVDSATELARRQAHEALVHRWDAQSVLGAPDPLGPPELAADGVGEFTERMLPDDADWKGAPGTLRLAATDTGAEFLLRLDPRPAPVPEPIGPVLASVLGPAGELDLWVWRRTASVAVEGDASVVAEFHGWADLD
jgi:uncharacterized protein (TIGR03083 family)